jgi:hypothetical protein
LVKKESSKGQNVQKRSQEAAQNGGGLELIETFPCGSILKT